MATTTHTITLTLIECPNCGVSFGITTDYEKRRRDDHRKFYCPQGHNMSYHYESDTERARKQRDRARDAQVIADRRATQAVQLQRCAERSAAAHKGHLTRAKNRIKNGVCPCCNRSFQNVERHMASQHPAYGNDR